MNLYGLTKVLSEDVARYHAGLGAVSTVALRLGMFVPDTFERYGFRLLFGGVDDRDVADTVLRALDRRPRGGFEAFDVMADSGLAPEDVHRLDADVAAVLDQRWPGTSELVRERGLDLEELVWGRTLYPSTGPRPCWDTAPGTASAPSCRPCAGTTAGTTPAPTSRGGAPGARSEGDAGPRPGSPRQG